jgi:hypothetical protein
MTLSRQIEQRIIDWISESDNQDATVCRAINYEKFPLPVVAVSCEVGDQLNSVHTDTFNCVLSVKVRAHAGDSGETDQCESITDAVEFILSDNQQGLIAVPECLRYDFAGTSFDWDEAIMVGEITVNMIARRVI